MSRRTDIPECPEFAAKWDKFWFLAVIASLILGCYAMIGLYPVWLWLWGLMFEAGF